MFGFGFALSSLFQISDSFSSLILHPLLDFRLQTHDPRLF
jgi:hypothetical protein